MIDLSMQKFRYQLRYLSIYQSTNQQQLHASERHSSAYSSMTTIRTNSRRVLRPQWSFPGGPTPWKYVSRNGLVFDRAVKYSGFLRHIQKTKFKVEQLHLSYTFIDDTWFLCNMYLVNINLTHSNSNPQSNSTYTRKILENIYISHILCK